jgi:hypothetical protein
MESVNNPTYRDEGFVDALDAYCVDDLSPAMANYRALVWSRVMVAAKRSEPELLLHIAIARSE